MVTIVWSIRWKIIRIVLCGRAWLQTKIYIESPIIVCCVKKITSLLCLTVFLIKVNTWLWNWLVACDWLEIQRSLTSRTVLSLLYVGGYVLTVALSLLLYYITACMDPGYVAIVNQVLMLSICVLVAINLRSSNQSKTGIIFVSKLFQPDHVLTTFSWVASIEYTKPYFYRSTIRVCISVSKAFDCLSR